MWNRSAAHTNNVFRLDRHIDAERKNEKKKRTTNKNFLILNLSISQKFSNKKTEENTVQCYH